MITIIERDLITTRDAMKFRFFDHMENDDYDH